MQLIRPITDLDVPPETSSDLSSYADLPPLSPSDDAPATEQ